MSGVTGNLLMVLLRADLILMLLVRRWRLREATWPALRLCQGWEKTCSKVSSVQLGVSSVACVSLDPRRVPGTERAGNEYLLK